MEATELTTLQTERFLRKIVEKFPTCDDTSIMTDVHVRISQDSGELVAFDDDDKEITRCVVEQWIGNQDENFYEKATAILRKVWRNNHEAIGHPETLQFCIGRRGKDFHRRIVCSR